jgi:hypothetical protein
MRSIAMVLLFTGCATAPVKENTEPNYLGKWTSPASPVERAGVKAWVARELVFTPDREDFVVDVYLDEALTQKLMTYRSSGPYQPKGPSSVVQGALEVDMTNDSDFITLHQDAPDMLKAAGLDDCNLVVGKEVDVGNGCAAPIFTASRCVDQDLIQVQGDVLRLGSQNVDHCKERPTTLGPPFTRVH